jgi:hypothetical protein
VRNTVNIVDIFHCQHLDVPHSIFNIGIPSLNIYYKSNIACKSVFFKYPNGLGMMAHACNLITGKAEAEGLQALDQPRLHG